MDMSIIVILWVVVMVIQNFADKKKSPPPPPPNLPQDFEIPTLANDPNFPGEEPIIFNPSSRPSAEVREINLAEVYRQKKAAALPEQKNFPQETAQKNFQLELTPSTAMNAIIWSEILNKPKSRR